MNWFFLVPLAIAGVGAYILKHSSDEIAYISTAILLVSLVVSLVISPWQVQLLLLILVVVAAQKLTGGNESAVPAESNSRGNATSVFQFNETATTGPVVNATAGEKSSTSISTPATSETGFHEHLSYRGVDYEVQLPIVEEMEEEIKGKYRGQTWTAHPIKTKATPAAKVELKYRGAIVKVDSVEPPVATEDDEEKGIVSL